MNVCQVGTGFQPISKNSATAVEIVIFNLSQNLSELGNKVKIIDLSHPKEEKTKLSYLEAKIPEIFNNSFSKKRSPINILKRFFFSLKAALLLYNIRKKEKFDIIHIQNQYPGIVIMILMKKVLKNSKFVYTSHIPFWALPKKDFGFGLYIKTFMERMCFKLADKIIAVGHAQRKGILEKTSLHPDKIEIIQNGVDQKKFCRDIINQKREGRKKNKISIISVARISKVKNQLLILKAIAPLIKKGQNIQVSLVGQLEEKDYVTEINNFIDINNLQKNARLIGPVPNNLMPGYYQAADIFISASNAEGFPLTVLEAMSCGCAILLSSIEPHKEISKEGEILFFQQNNLAEISQVIESLIIDKKKLKLLKKLAANSAKKYYSWKKVALDNIRIYNQIRKI